MDIILFKNLFLLEDNFFSILCWLLPCNKMNKSQIQICPLPPETPPDFPPHPTPLGCHRALGWAPCVGTAAFHQLSILHMVMYIYPCYFFQFVHPLLPILYPKSVLYVCITIPALQIGSSTSLELTQMHSFCGWVIFRCIYLPQLLYPFICWWTSRLFPCPSYCKLCCDERWATYVFFQLWFSQDVFAH